MTPKEKAEQLVRAFGYKIGKELKNGGYEFNIEKASELALFSVDEIINSSPTYPWAKDVGAKAQGLYENVIFPTNYWRDVKSEILQIKLINN